MLIQRTDDLPAAPVKMDGVRGVAMRVLLGREHGMPHFSMRHFSVEPGGHTPRHRHDYEHEVFVLEGEGTVEHEGELRAIQAGDAIYVPANALHQFVNRGEEPLRFLCLVPGATNCGEPTPGG